MFPVIMPWPMTGNSDRGGDGCGSVLSNLLSANNATIMSVMFPTRPRRLTPPNDRAGTRDNGMCGGGDGQ